MITRLDPQSTIGELVTERPGRSRVFERLNVDYCCGGKLPLAEACEKRGLDVDTVLAQLQQADAEADVRDASLADADAMGLTELADHIEQTHHAYLRSELPRLDQMTEKVYRVHGESDPRLAEVRWAFTALKHELESHMPKEEQILFPIIRRMEAEGRSVQTPFGSIAQPIAQMELEHEQAGDALATIREATDGYRPPLWACNTYRAMLDALRQLEQDMHQHVHKENNVLFPKALELEAQLARKERV